MTDRRTAHKNALLMAFVMASFVVGLGVPAVQGVSQIHNYVVPVLDAWTGIQFGWMKLTTTSYSSGTNLGTVVASQTSDSILPLTISNDGTSVSLIDSHRKLASGHFTCTAWLIWPLIPLEIKSANLYTQVSYYGSGFSYVDWWT